jgi:N-acetylglucosaminyldiphosphoundecaprenol N-acetyl-beta-D-mannosaminyltransferase
VYQHEYDFAPSGGSSSAHLGALAGEIGATLSPGRAIHADLPQVSPRERLGHESTQVINGIRFDLLERDDLVALAKSFIASGSSHVVHFLAVDPTVRAARDAAYREVLNAGDINIADGQPVAWAVRLNGRYTERIAGTDGVALLCEAGLQDGRSHYLYGGSQQVNERLNFQLRRRYQGIRIVGAEAPPMGMPAEQELRASAARIRASGADLLWIGIGTPNQHYVASRLREFGAAPVILCVGAAFDFVSGTKQRAPEWAQKLGLEWCHRLLSEPRRLGPRYLAGNPRFVVGVAREYLARVSS